MLGRQGLTGSALLVQHSRTPGASLFRRTLGLSLIATRAFNSTDTAQHVKGQPCTAASMQQLQQHLADLEKVLPTLSCSQLASTVSSVVLAYQAANLSCQASAGLGEQQSVGAEHHCDPHTIVKFYTDSLPDQSFLLTLRDTVGQYLARHPASLTAAAQAGAEEAACSVACSTCHPSHLAKILAAIAGLPIMVVQPLPIGFGTPRWYRPLAAADPAAWERWLADMAAVYTALLLQQQQQQQQQAEASQQQDQQQPVLEQLADFTISLACAMRWANVNVNDDRLQTHEFKQQVLRVLQQNHEQRPPGQQQQRRQEGLSLSAPQPLAGSYAHRLTYTMLLLLLPPPRPLLSSFFEATAPLLPELFSVDEVQGLIRGLLFLGAVPSEPWLHALVDMVRFRAQELPPKDVQGFVEGFRFFGTQAGRAGFLRDATAQLEEFTLC